MPVDFSQVASSFLWDKLYLSSDKLGRHEARIR
jgi:hypothetical protein